MALRLTSHVRSSTAAVGLLIALGAFLGGALPAAAQSISGTVVNNSVWRNNETNVPPHWYVSPELGTSTDGTGRVVVALFYPSSTYEYPLDVDPLDPDDDITGTVALPSTSNNVPYTLGSLLAPGPYDVVAWVDGNINGLPDVGEPIGVRTVIISDESSVSHITVTIEDDTDSDTMEDWWEVHWFGDLSQTRGMDFDNDGLSNGEEYDLINVDGVYVEPDNWDTDDDEMDDAWELFYFRIGAQPDPVVYDRFGDPDVDTIINFDEYMGPDGVGWRRDVNGDNIGEYTTSRDAMSPLSGDTDQDGATDAEEFLSDLTHPVHSMSGTNFYPRSLEMSVNGGAGADMTDPSGVMYAFGSGGGTVEFWVRPGTDGDGIIYGFTNSIVVNGVTNYIVADNLPHFRISLEDYRPKMEILNGATVMASVGGVGVDGSVQQLEPDAWTHVACVIAPGNNSLDLYVDGILLIAQESFLKPTFVLGTPTICQDFTDGYLDELRVWDYPRSAADIEHWSGRIYPAPGYVQQWALRESGSLAQMYKYSNPHPLLGYLRFDDGGPRVENFAFINHGLYPYEDEYYLSATATASVTADQAVPMIGSDDADGDGLPEWWVELHNIEKYLEYYSSAYGPVMVGCPDDASLVDGFEYF
ncbi:MAG: LamG domain-containing protein, partial [Verrucomicrobia bacterium]|nr:LamG domain-containing protein [Verrucomicrobiota bacterium]